MGTNLGRAIITNGDFTAYVCDSAATGPSSQITLAKLVIVIIVIVFSSTLHTVKLTTHGSENGADSRREQTSANFCRKPLTKFLQFIIRRQF